MGAIGEVYDRVVRAIGLDPADPKWRKRAHADIESMEGIEFDAMLRGWIYERTAKEVVRHMTAHNVPAPDHDEQGYRRGRAISRARHARRMGQTSRSGQ